MNGAGSKRISVSKTFDRYIEKFLLTNFSALSRSQDTERDPVDTPTRTLFVAFTVNPVRIGLISPLWNSVRIMMTSGVGFLSILEVCQMAELSQRRISQSELVEKFKSQSKFPPRHRPKRSNWAKGRMLASSTKKNMSKLLLTGNWPRWVHHLVSLSRLCQVLAGKSLETTLGKATATPKEDKASVRGSLQTLPKQH